LRWLPLRERFSAFRILDDDQGTEKERTRRPSPRRPAYLYFAQTNQGRAILFPEILRSQGNNEIGRSPVQPSSLGQSEITRLISQDGHSRPGGGDQLERRKGWRANASPEPRATGKSASRQGFSTVKWRKGENSCSHRINRYSCLDGERGIGKERREKTNLRSTKTREKKGKRLLLFCR